MSNNTNNTNEGTKRKYSIIDSIDLTTDGQVKKIKFDDQPSTSTARRSPEPLMLPNSSYYYKHVPSVSEILELDKEKQTNEEKKKLSEDENLTRRKLAEKEFNYDSGPVQGLIWWKQTREKIYISVDVSSLVSPTTELDIMLNNNELTITSTRLYSKLSLLTTTFYKTVENKKWDVVKNGHILKMEFQKKAPEFWEKCFLYIPIGFRIMEYDILCCIEDNLDKTIPSKKEQELLNKKAALKELLAYVSEDYQLIMSTDQNITNLSSDKDSSTAVLTTDLLNISQPSVEPRSDKVGECGYLLFASQVSANQITEDLSTSINSPTTVSSAEVSLFIPQPSFVPLLPIEYTQDPPLKLKTSINSIVENTSVYMESPTKSPLTEVSPIIPQYTVEPLTHSKEDIENALLIMQLSIDQIYVDPAINTEISTKASSTDISPAILESSSLEPQLQQNIEELENSQLALQISTESFTVDPSTITKSPTKASNEVPPIISNSSFDNEHYKIAAGLSFDSELIPPTFP